MILSFELCKQIFFWCGQGLLNISFGFLEHKTSNNVGKSTSCVTIFLTSTITNFEQAEYFKIFNLFVIILVISLLLFSVAYFLSLSVVKDSEKLSQYECGFEPFDEATRHPFDVHFYIVGILFLIFDVEVALLFPWVLGLKSLNLFGFFTMGIFLIILTIGFFYEWHRGALIWPHKQIKL
jgi:NADH-quinone oxidoreductase subunit A